MNWKWLKRRVFEFLACQRKQKELVLETEKQNNSPLPNSGPLATAPEAVPWLSVPEQEDLTVMDRECDWPGVFRTVPASYQHTTKCVYLALL